MTIGIKCPKCGGAIKYGEIVETQFYENTYYDNVLGRCTKCNQRYSWTDVYKYSHTEELTEIAEEEQ